jgi:ATP adenylyltransferase
MLKEFFFKLFLILLIVWTATLNLSNIGATMEFLYAPWRGSYIKQSTTQECPFCNKIQQENDRENLLLKRYRYCAVFMNKFPYNKGHLLIIPYMHTKNIYELRAEERNEIIEVTAQIIKIIEAQLNTQGINVGMNIGKVSGGSIEDHLHIHIIPRFLGDTNFLAVTGQTKVITYDIMNLYDQLYSLFNKNNNIDF